MTWGEGRRIHVLGLREQMPQTGRLSQQKRGLSLSGGRKPVTGRQQACSAGSGAGTVLPVPGFRCWPAILGLWLREYTALPVRLCP